jgi:signal transduction histidine kinase
VALILWNLTLRNTVASQTSLIAERVAKESKLEERQRIGRELHDTLQQELTGIGMLIGNSKANLHRPEKAQESLIMAERMVQRASEESRSSIQDLMSVTLENRGLKAALQELVRPMAELKGAHFHIHFPAVLPRLSTRMETSLLRIAHEAAANAGKHAQATEVHLTVETTADVIRMIIQDNGIGFDVASTRSTGQRNFGLLTMDERALKLKGQLTVVSALHVGTTVTVTLPLPKHV